MQITSLKAVRTQIGWRGLYKGSLAVLEDGSLITAVCEWEKTGSWPVHIFRSFDNGRSWQQAEYTPPLFGKEPGLTLLKTGGLLLTLENSDDTVAYSDDRGKSWIVTSMKPEGENTRTVRSPIEHADGSVSLLRSKRGKAWLYHSSDFGRTWDGYEEIETWDSYYSLFNEADYLRLPDGRILASSRFSGRYPIKGTEPPWPVGSVNNDHASGHMVLLESEDDGCTWKGPRDFLSYSEVQAQLTLLADGRILCTYTNYHLPFGIAAVLSSDMGKTWNYENKYQLAISNGICTGWPTTRQLADGSLLTVYALEPYHLESEDKPGTEFQCVRWQLSDEK